VIARAAQPDRQACAAWPARPSAPTPPVGNALLKNIAGGIHDARVDVAEFLQREQVRRVLGILELIRGRLIDRHGARIRRGIGQLPGVQLPGGETILALRFVRHAAKSPLGKDMWPSGVRASLGPHPARLRIHYRLSRGGL
jgi:hypothetical protein